MNSTYPKEPIVWDLAVLLLVSTNKLTIQILLGTKEAPITLPITLANCQKAQHRDVT